jgi:hypothetical protein
MGLFDDIFGTKQKNTAKATLNQTQSQTQNSNTTGSTSSTNNQTGSSSSTSSGNQSSTTNQSTTGKGTVSTLAPELQTFLTTLLPQLSANAATGGADNSGAMREIAAMLTNKASANPAALQGTIKSQQDLAKLDFETGAGQESNVIAQAIGSKGNTFSQAVDLKAQSDLATKLSAIVAQATLASQQQTSADLLGAGSLIGDASVAGATDANTALAPLLQALQTLKGASTTSEQSENTTGQTDTSSQSVSQQIESLLSEILGTSSSSETNSANAVLNSNQNSNSTGSSTPGLFQSAVNLIGAFK